MKPDVAKLRQTILQLAVEGKLVAQDSSDKPASELLNQIESEKRKLIAEGKIRKSQPLPPVLTDEKPFEIPDSWKWVRLGDAMALITDGAHQSPPTSNEGLPYITVRDVTDKDAINFIDAKKITPKHFAELERTGCKPIYNDVLFSKDGTVGKTAVVPSEPEFVILSSLAILRPVGATVRSQFLRYLLKSPKILESALGMKTGVAIRRVVLVNLKKLPIPLPPIEEQKRIVAKVDELMALCDKLEGKSDNFLETLAKLRQTILQLAVEGKLVGEEGEYLPTNLGDIIKVSSGVNLTKSSMRDGSIPVYGGNGVAGYHDKENVGQSTVVIGRVGVYCGSVHITPEKAWITDNAFITRFDTDKFETEYIFWLLKGTDLASNVGGAAQPVISGKRIYPIKLKIPKDKHQQLIIVEKVDKLMALCDELEGKLYYAAREP